jgi:hypothetical protein
MIQEADEFAVYLHSFEASLRTYERAIIGGWSPAGGCSLPKGCGAVMGAAVGS